ncbi:MAG: aminotransferase class I/II-fold pyridoxal phosphate-dependent enzyme [Actinobacteria bacterium]|nr:aminotransferase class I/II-fold pyridoxal phosphate-dependent enzyme [Actinomycetota bacterium]
MNGFVDLRSDTVTTPTPEMRRAMAEAEVGDDVYGEDPTVNKLQELAAEITGKEAALYVPSGTMGNQVALRTLTHHGDNVIVEEGAHILQYELNAGPALSGVQFRALPGRGGVLNLDEVRAIATARTGWTSPAGEVALPGRINLVAMENTHNRASGAIYPLEDMRAMAAFAREIEAGVYLDGARIFNASVATGVPVKDYASLADIMSFCFSKGLAAPVGSCLVGSTDLIAQARVWRKRYGGGMRQAGVIAAACIVSLTQMVDRLADDHANARRLAQGLAELEPKGVDLDTVQTNIINFEAARVGKDARALMGALRDEGVLTSTTRPGAIRMLTHKDVEDADVDRALAAYKKALT